MKIVSCFTDIKELEPLAEAGADEFYTAVKQAPAFSFGFLPRRQLPQAIKKARALGRRISLAVNAIHSAAFADLSVLNRRITAIDAMGVDAFIISNPYILEMLYSRKPRLRAELHLSSIQPVFNSRSAAFFSRLGISRIILPNQLAPAEAVKILAFCRKNNIETEIFDYRFFGCAYVNGRCQLHRPGYYTLSSAMPDGSLCRINAGHKGLVKIKTLDIPDRAEELPGLIKRLEHRFTRGGSPRLSNAAAFFDFFASGAQYLKYGTRHDAMKIKIRKVKELRAMIGLAESLSLSKPAAEARQLFIRELTRWDGN